MVTWRIIPSAAEPFIVFFRACDRRLVVLPRFTGGVKYHPIRVMWQFSFQQSAFISSVAFDLLRLYPLNTTAATVRLANLLHDGVQSSDIATVKGLGCSPEYLTEV